MWKTLLCYFLCADLNNKKEAPCGVLDQELHVYITGSALNNVVLEVLFHSFVCSFLFSLVLQWLFHCSFFVTKLFDYVNVTALASDIVFFHGPERPESPQGKRGSSRERYPSGDDPGMPFNLNSTNNSSSCEEEHDFIDTSFDDVSKPPHKHTQWVTCGYATTFIVMCMCVSHKNTHTYMFVTATCSFAGISDHTKRI